MTAKILDGKALAARITEELKPRAAKLAQSGRKPGLAVILVGEDPASQVYVRNKIRACERVGIESLEFRLPAETTQEALLAKIAELNADDAVDGILVQLPLPMGYDERYLLSLIPDSKDVDGFSPTNMGLLAMNKPRTISCTPYGVMKLIESTGTSLKGKRAVVIGRSNTVGKPMAMLLLNADCTVTVCHSKTADLAKVASEADILVAAIGKPRFVTADMVKEGAIVIDVGINRVDGKLVGDVDFDAVKDKASFITPVPGGVGPMTITMLLANTLQAAEKAEESR